MRKKIVTAVIGVAMLSVLWLAAEDNSQGWLDWFGPIPIPPMITQLNGSASAVV